MTESKLDNKFQVKGKEKIIKASVLNPENAGLRMVLNFISIDGKVDMPIFKLFDKKWAKVKADVKGLYATKTGAYKLGAPGFIQETAVQSDVWVVNMLCLNKEGKVDEVSLDSCLKKVCKFAKDEKASVHISSLLVEQSPKFQNLCKTHLINNGVSVSYYQENE